MAQIKLAGGGLLRLTPTWVSRSFLQPSRRIKLHPNDYYRFGADRGGIDERRFGSTTEAANEGWVWHEGLSFCIHEGKKPLLKNVVSPLERHLKVFASRVREASHWLAFGTSVLMMMAAISPKVGDATSS